jgi:4-hydroxy-4-methyl-2-oxoglutarate aldolase
VTFRLSDESRVGLFEPADTRQVAFRRVAESQLAKLRNLGGLSPATSDVLDELGWRTSVSSSFLEPRHGANVSVVGHAVTIRYLPERHHLHSSGNEAAETRLAHHVLFRLAKPGDVMVVDASGCGQVSVMGGLAATAAVRAGLAGAIVDGGIRDVREVRSSKLSVWSRYVTPVTGKHRLEAISINSPIQCGGVQVRPGDLVIADESGVSFVPTELVDQLLARLAEIASVETAELQRHRVASD